MVIHSFSCLLSQHSQLMLWNPHAKHVSCSRKWAEHLPRFTQGGEHTTARPFWRVVLRYIHVEGLQQIADILMGIRGSKHGGTLVPYFEPYFVVIFPYIGQTNIGPMSGRDLQFRFPKWPFFSNYQTVKHHVLPSGYLT